MRTFLAEKRSLALPLLASLAFLSAAATRLTAEDWWARPAGRMAVEFGIDSLERKFYRPEWSFSLPLAFAGQSRAFADLSYSERLNGRLEGTIDFWLDLGLEHRFSKTLSAEAGLNHFCRHLTSLRNPYILNLNELVGRLWVHGEKALAGFGLGTYLGGNPGYDALAVFNLRLRRLLLDELRFEAELKWVNFEEVLPVVELSLELVPGTEIFLKSVATYDLDRAAYLGLRFLSEGANARYVRSVGLSAGAYPFYDTHKLLVQGSFRLAFLQEAGRSFLLDADFRSPILSGRSFLGEFWPDRMLYALAAEYERKVGGLFAALYGRYFADLPVDKAVPFRASLAAGLALRNQTDFDRLQNPIRWEIRAGWDFKFDYDLGGKIGVNTVGAKFARVGAEFRLRANAEQGEAEGLAFLDFGNGVSVRPFVGLRKITYLAGGPPPPDPFKRKIIAGLSLFKWFD
jgi:hypothetical protein